MCGEHIRCKNVLLEMLSSTSSVLKSGLGAKISLLGSYSQCETMSSTDAAKAADSGI